MTPKQLLRWLIARSKGHREGVPMSEIPADCVDALVTLQGSGEAMLTADPPLVWVHPDCYKDRRNRRHAGRQTLESDLPPDVDLLKHLPDRADTPPAGQRRNGEPIYRPRDEPSQLIAMGPTAWPPPGTTIRSRRYREPRAVYTEVTVSDLYVTAETCPVCGKPDGRGRKQTSNNTNCLACDLWARDITEGISTLETPPEVEIKPAKKKGRKAG